MLREGVRPSIRDNGREFTPDVSTGTRHGLASMAACAQKIEGRFTVLSNVNEETFIVFDLPNEVPYARR
jgi:signal transduction histidine kinase